MRIVAISDTHTRHTHLTSKSHGPILPDGDLLIHGGDFSNQGRKGEVEDFFKWCKEIAPRYKHGIVVIAGNHDKSFDIKFGDLNHDTGLKDIPIFIQEIKADLAKHNIHYLENSSITIAGVNIWGSPISPWFHGDNWAFNKHRAESEIGQVWREIPLNTDIIVTHTPIAYKLDYVPNSNDFVGCEDLRFRVKEIKPLLHICGHIHEGYGWDYDQDTTFVNASICNLMYDPINKPIVIELDKENRDVKID